MATLFAWTGALRKRGEIDGIQELVSFTEKLESAAMTSIEKGIMTKDLAELTESANSNIVKLGCSC